MSIALERRCFTVSFAIPCATELSVCTGEPGWSQPISIKVVRIGQLSWPFMNRAPTYASEAEAITLRIMLETTWMAPLSSGFGFVDGSLLKKKNPPALDLALGSDI